jgi:hypothetical protein
MPLPARSLSLASLGALFCLAFILAKPGFAQDAPESPPESPSDVSNQGDAIGEDLGPMRVNLALDPLLFGTAGNNVQDPVWRLQPEAGKRILLLPFTVENVNKTSKLSRMPITVRTGRFIGFVIPASDRNAGPGQAAADLNQVIRAKPGELRELLFPVAQPVDQSFDQPADEPGVDDATDAAAEAAVDAEADEPTPETAPRLSRELVLHPDGTVQWEMDRNFHSAQLQNASEQNPYAYKIDPQQLRDAQPPRAERLTRNAGEDARAFAQRKREQQLAEREKQTAYRALRDSLRRLPETFREPTPDVLYAAIEVPDSDTLSLQGPAPLPWTLDAEKKALLDVLSRGGNALQADEAENTARRAVAMIQGHPLDAQAVALATLRSRLAGQVAVDDAGYDILSRLLTSDDKTTRRIALYGVATTNPPTLASAQLIGVASEAAIGEARKMLGFQSLSKLFSTQTADPDTARTLMTRVSETIADPQGPDAPRVIEQVLASIAPAGGIGRGGEADDVTAIMIELIDLSGLESSEYAGVARAVVAAAPTNPVAAGWLDRQLLASDQSELVNAALSQLYESRIEPKQDPFVGGGPTAEPQGDANEPVPAVADDVLVLSDSIPMTRAEHALVALFDSSDDLQQAAAWAALGRFHIALPDRSSAEGFETPGQGGADAQADPAVALFDAILEKALARDETPASVIAFIGQQRDPALVAAGNERFVSLVASGELPQKTARAAFEAYTQSPQRYTQALQATDASDQQQFVQTLYRSQDQEAPLMAGLIADGGQTLTWFNDFVKENESLPNLEDWTARVESVSEATLLQSASSVDDTVSVAASAALVAAAGGDADQELAFAQSVLLLEDRSQANVREAWEEQRGEIYADAFKRSRGTYELVVTFFEAQALDPAAVGGEPAEPVVGKRVDLGVVEMRAEGLDLSLSADAVTLSPTPGRLGIRIDQPAALRSFSKPELSAIAPEQLSRPIDLLPQPGGLWAGDTNLSDGRRLRVSLEPTN